MALKVVFLIRSDADQNINLDLLGIYFHNTLHLCICLIRYVANPLTFFRTAACAAQLSAICLCRYCGNPSASRTPRRVLDSCATVKVQLVGDRKADAMFLQITKRLSSANTNANVNTSNECPFERMQSYRSVRLMGRCSSSKRSRGTRSCSPETCAPRAKKWVDQLEFFFFSGVRARL